ncbi:amino acid adenylation domain-containing protein [Streptosporangium sp. NPDC050855]|uniref:amino acid adenylation domain-containing protein n=1 Tax=Streptosporangium sp. NPDC050855 TaxID=3366194 RepID=UPI00379D1EF4
MSLHRLLIDAAARFPDNLALAGPAGEMTYRELDLRADALAHVLSGEGVRPGDRVVIWEGKTPLAVVAMQAVLRLGAAYVPAGESAPAARVAALIRDCSPRVVCADGDRLKAIEAIAGDAGDAGDADGDGGTGGTGGIGGTVDLDGHRALPAGPRPVPVDHPAGADDLAYVLYTSGSTGVPKGVSVSHRAARAFVDWAAAELDARPDDRFANHAPFTFDLSVLDLYAAFSAGATVCPVPAELAYAPARMVEFLHRERISVWYSVPSALTLMMRDGGLLERPAPGALRAVLFAGEPFPIAGVRDLAAWTGARLLNLYGPTETNVCTFHEVTPGDLARDRSVPIGRASCGDVVRVMRPDGRVAGVGEEGELVVEGPTVMLGYWGHEPQTGPYRTGDIVRVLPGGSLDYLGRRDHMVKVRGYRVELGEVEAVLGSHPQVADVAVVVSGEGADARLRAFVLPAPGAAPGVLGLKRHSAERLPPYMIADEILLVGELPRTRNGKIDRAALSSGTTPYGQL